MNIGEGISGAVFHDRKRYRVALWRTWNQRGPKLLFIGLNPSTANETRDDRTVVRMVNFAKSWGYGGLFVGNLFSIVSADPNFVRQYLGASDISGRPNDQAIKFMRDLASTVVVGWGEWGKRAGRRPAAVLALVGEPVHCFKVNQSGEPTHPLYLPGNSKPIRYYRKGAK